MEFVINKNYAAIMLLMFLGAMCTLLYLGYTHDQTDRAMAQKIERMNRENSELRSQLQTMGACCRLSERISILESKLEGHASEMRRWQIREEGRAWPSPRKGH